MPQSLEYLHNLVCQSFPNKERFKVQKQAWDPLKIKIKKPWKVHGYDFTFQFETEFEATTCYLKLVFLQNRERQVTFTCNSIVFIHIMNRLNSQMDLCNYCWHERPYVIMYKIKLIILCRNDTIVFGL